MTDCSTLTYETRIQSAFADVADSHLLGKRYTTHEKHPDRVTVTLGPEGLRVESESGWEHRYDARADERILLDHRDETYLDAPRVERALEAARTRRPLPLRRRESAISRDDVDVPGADSLTRYELDVGGLHLDCWTLPVSETPRRATRRLWDVMLPGVTLDEDVGAPAEIRLATDDGRATVRLVDRDTVAELDVDVRAPEGYRRDGDAERRDTKPTETVPFTPEPSPMVSARQTLRDIGRDTTEQRSKESIRRHSLRRRGQDIAWLSDQDALDDLRGFVNDLTGVFDEFYGDGDGGDEPMHVVVDWWSELDDHLDFGDADADVKRAIRQLWLYVRVMNAEELVTVDDHDDGLTTGEQADYQQALATAGTANGVQLQRVLEFQQVFDAARRERLANAQFDVATEPARLDFGPREMSGTVTVAGQDAVDYELWDFDTELTLGSGGLLDELHFADGRIRATIDVEQVNVDFQYATTPAASVANVLCGIFTLGACTVAELNYGYGYFNIDDLTVALDLRPTVQDGTLELVATLDRSDSSMDTSVAMFGLNLVQSVLTGLYNAVVSLMDSYDDDIYAAVEDALESDVLSTALLQWPTIWNARQGPPVSDPAGLFEQGAGAFEAELASDAGLPHGFAADLDADHVDQTGFVFSRRYLIAWLREQTGIPSGESALEVRPLLQEFGITLPDPTPASQSAGDVFDGDFGTDSGRPPEFADCSAPATPPDEASNRLRFVRRAPTVRFPDSDDPVTTQTAGTVVMEYDIEIAAVLEAYRAQAHVVPGRCLDVGGGLPGRPGGAGPDPMPPMVDPRVMAAQRVAHEGIPVGMTVGERARFFERIERLGRASDLESLAGGAEPITPKRPDAETVDRLSMDFAKSERVRSDGGDVSDTPLGELGGRATGVGGKVGGIDGIGSLGGDGHGFGGVDGTIGRGGFGPGGFGPGLDTVCEPPHCEYIVTSTERTTETYLTAHVRATCDLELGFQQFGGIWLPEIALNPVRAGADADLTVTVEALTTGDIFATVPEDDLRAALADLCRSDAEALLAPALGAPFIGGVEANRSLLPKLPVKIILAGDADHWGWDFERTDDVTQTLFELVNCRQSGAGDPFEYVIDGDLLYWPFGFDQSISEHLV